MSKYFIHLLKKIGFYNDYFKIINLERIRINIRQYTMYKIRYKLRYRFKSSLYIHWPTHRTSTVFGNITIGINSNVGANPGCYIQGIGKITVGNYTLIAENVGIISANHDIYDYRVHKKEEVIIGDYCWIGMNSVILPGVVLGNHTIVAAGSIVTKSFKEGYCIIAGNPAKIIKVLDKSKCVDYVDEHEYYGFISKEEFERWRKDH